MKQYLEKKKIIVLNARGATQTIYPGKVSNLRS